MLVLVTLLEEVTLDEVEVELLVLLVEVVVLPRPGEKEKHEKKTSCTPLTINFTYLSTCRVIRRTWALSNFTPFRFEGTRRWAAHDGRAASASPGLVHDTSGMA